jgi:hypothetical protein
VNGRPLTGEKSKLFRRLCGLPGIEPRDCIVTHVFDYQLPGNRLKLACTRLAWVTRRGGAG